MKIASFILAKSNWLSMADFMDIALFEPEQGYYSQHIPGIGWRGDFSTSATQSTLLARAIVDKWRQCCKTINRHLPLLEIGGGSADLMLCIQKQLSFIERLRTRYYMVERSEHLRDLQRQIGGGFVRAHETMHKALKAVNGRAFIFSNELPDAFPARQFVYQEERWYELGLALVDGQVIRQAWENPLPESCAFAQWAQDGQIIEVHESYHRWYSSWQHLWKEGSHITIDYGDINERIYYRRPKGGMRGYKAHQLLEVEQLPALAGNCDITCDVNFTDLVNLARHNAPDDIIKLCSQHELLAPYAYDDSAADAHLIAIPGAGDHFQVLQQDRFDV